MCYDGIIEPVLRDENGGKTKKLDLGILFWYIRHRKAKRIKVHNLL
jgi:hypothetical protein